MTVKEHIMRVMETLGAGSVGFVLGLALWGAAYLWTSTRYEDVPAMPVCTLQPDSAKTVTGEPK